MMNSSRCRKKKCYNPVLLHCRLIYKIRAYMRNICLHCLINELAALRVIPPCPVVPRCIWTLYARSSEKLQAWYIHFKQQQHISCDGFNTFKQVYASNNYHICGYLYIIVWTQTPLLHNSRTIMKASGLKIPPYTCARILSMTVGSKSNITERGTYLLGVSFTLLNWSVRSVLPPHPPIIIF